MSISVNVVLRKDKINKNNTAPIHLRFTQIRKVRYVSTGLTIELHGCDDQNQRINPSYRNAEHIQLQIDTLLHEYQKRINKLEILEIEVSFETLLDRKEREVRKTVAEYFNYQIEQMRARGKVSTAIKYQATLTSLQKFKSMNIRFNDITSKFLTDFELFLLSEGIKSNSVATKFSVLKAVYNKAIVDKVLMCADNPFQNYKIGRLWTTTRKRAIRKEDIQRLIQMKLPSTRSPYLEMSRDIFLFSYLSAGINFKDIATLRYCDIDQDRIYYSRHKTNKGMTCLLVPEAREIISKYATPNRDAQEYIFSILNRHVHKTEQQIHNRVHKVLVHINKGLKEWSLLLGLNVNLTTYVARHSFATVLKRSGVSTSIISESLGHSSEKITQIYLDSFENSQIDAAMSNLL